MLSRMREILPSALDVELALRAQNGDRREARDHRREDLLSLLELRLAGRPQENDSADRAIVLEQRHHHGRAAGTGLAQELRDGAVLLAEVGHDRGFSFGDPLFGERAGKRHLRAARRTARSRAGDDLHQVT